MAEKVDEQKKRSIHDIGDTITTQYTMKEIEKAFHPRAKENVQAELEDLVSMFADKHRDAATGSIKNPEKAADDFMMMFAKYHFGAAFDSVKNDKKQVASILQEKYGIRREALLRAFKRKGAYVSRTAVFEQHVTPLVDTVVDVKQKGAQESLNVYLTDGETRPQVEEHLQTRTGRKLRKGLYLDLTDAVNVIGAYMAQPGSEEALDKPGLKVGLADEVAGRPGLHHVFEGGDQLHQRYREVAKKVDSTHRFGGGKYKKVA